MKPAALPGSVFSHLSCPSIHQRTTTGSLFDTRKSVVASGSGIGDTFRGKGATSDPNNSNRRFPTTSVRCRVCLGSRRPLPSCGPFSSHRTIRNMRSNRRRTTTQDRVAAIQLPCRVGDAGSNRFVEPMDVKNLSLVLSHYVDRGQFQQASDLWTQIANSSFRSVETVSLFLDSYSRAGCFEEMLRVVDEMTSQDSDIARTIFTLAVECLGKVGQLELMEYMISKMTAKGFEVDSATGNAFVKYYSVHGTLPRMECAYQRLKMSRILIEKDTIRAMASTYIACKKFYELGEFLKDVGLGRRNVGNLLWNLLLLSYAANFKMKSLQREFLNMLNAGFSPDLNTFNIRALAFSRMSMLWDLHLSIEHMSCMGVPPDLVTYGCVVDAYMERRLGKNLDFVMSRMRSDAEATVLTDGLFLEAFGEGDFHASSKSLIESGKGRRRWSYSDLVRVYLRKQFRSNQIFWNY